MIHLCTCTGGSTSAISSSKSSGGTVSCKNCGGRPAIDGKKSRSCLLSTVLELSSLINSDFTWTKVSKGCRSSSRRPRRSNSIDLDCRDLFSKGFKGLEMPVSESEKLGVSVLGCHFGEKAEHIPIKKRRFLIRASSPPCNNPNLSLGVAERHTTSPKASCHGLLLNPNANCLPTVSEGVTRMSEIGSNDEKLDVKKLVKEDDFSGISILAAAACSNSLGAEVDHCEGSGIVSSVTKNHEVSTAVEVNEQELKIEEPDSHMSTTPSKVDESTCNNSASQAPLELAFSKTNQDPSIQKSPARDARFSWDLNIVMDAWEEPFVNEREVSASDVAKDNDTLVEEKKNDYTKDNSGSKSKNISSQNLPVELKSLAHENEELKLGICEPFSCEFGNAQHAVAVKTESKHIDNVNDAIPVTRNLTVENSTHGIFSRWANLQGQSPSGFGSAQVDTKLSMDCSVPPGFDHCLTLHSSKENIGFSSTIVPSTATTTQTVMPKHDLSLASATSLENGPHRREVTSNKVDDEAMTKMELTTNVVAVEDMVIKEEADKDGLKPVNQTTFGAHLVGPSSMMVDQHAAISFMHDAARSDAEAPLENGFGYDNMQSDNRAGYGVDKQDELSVGYDSQYEDGELRESSIYAWKGFELNNEEYEYDMENREDDFTPRVVDAHETSSQNGHGGSSGMVKVIEAGFVKEADLTSSVVLPEKLHSSDEVLSGLVPNEISNGQENRERQHIVQNANHSEWKINVSGWDILPENQRISSNNFTKTRNFTGRKFSYGEQKDRFETGDVEMRAEGSRFYRKESLTRIGGPSTRDEYVSRGRFRMQGCSSKADDGFTSRPERESGELRSFGRGRYSPHHRSSGRGVGMWNRSPERGRDPKHLPSPSYQGPSFARSMLDDSRTVDNITNEGGMDSSRGGRPNTSSYVTRQPFRSRSPMNREAQDFRARLGLRPSGDTGHDRFVNLGRGRGRGRSVRYGTRLDGEGPRGRYHGPANDECDEFLTEYSHPFPRRRRCFSPIERRGNTSYKHHQSNSRSPSRPRTRSPIGNTGFRRRSRSPDFRPDTRIRRPRSPNCRDHANGYNSGPRNNNSSPPSSRWVNYKERPVFDRRSPPPGRTNAPQGERFRFYDSSRKKQNEYYRSGHPGHFSDLKEAGRGRPRYVGNDSDQPDNGYRRGGFVRRYNMDTPTKRFHFDEDELGRGFDARDQHALELLARTNLNSNSSPKPSCNGADSRFRDFPRRVREDGDLKRRSREGKDPKESEHIEDDFEKRPKEVKDQSSTTTTTTTTTTTKTTNLDSMPNEAVKEGDDIKTNVGP